MSTLDQKHNKKVKDIRKNEINVEKQILDLEKKKRKLLNDNSIDSANILMNINSEIAKLEKIKKCDLLDYHTQNSRELFAYYENLENTKQHQLKDLNTKGKILEYFNSEKNDDKTNEENEISEYNCKKCNSSNLLYSAIESMCECKDCGYIEYSDSIKPILSYKDPIRETSYFAYKRANHFNEWLSSVQGQNTSNVPSTVIKTVINTIKKDRKNVSEINHVALRDILKRNNLNKYYENIPYILITIDKKNKFKITRKLENRLKQMFQEIQAPFIKFCPSSRKNFLSYSYVLHKFFEILKYKKENYEKIFPLLKSREKLHQSDIIWQKICQELNWKFNKSI